MIQVRTMPLLICVLVIAVLTTALSVAQTLYDVFDFDLFVRLVITLGLAGTMTAFLVAAEYDLPNARRKVFLGALIFLATVLVIFIISQMWFGVLAQKIFFKLIIGNIVLLAVSALGLMSFEDFSSKDPSGGKYT